MAAADNIGKPKIKLLLFSFLLSLAIISCKTKSVLKKELFDKVELGMSREEVKNMLGKPDEIRPSVDSDSNFFYHTKNTLFVTKFAEVYFNKDNRVSFLLYDSP